MRNRPEIHERLADDNALERGSERVFGFAFAIVFTAIALLPLAFGDRPRWWGLSIAGALLLIAAARPSLLAPLNWVWFRVRLVLNFILTYLAMGLLFYAVFTPMGLKDLLRRRYAPNAESYWIHREPGPTPESMKNQF